VGSLQIFASMLSLLVAAGLDPAIHADAPQTKAWPQIKQSDMGAWIAGSSPAMTKWKPRRPLHSPPLAQGAKSASIPVLAMRFLHPRFAAQHGKKTPSVFDRVTPNSCNRAVGPASARSSLAQVARMSEAISGSDIASFTAVPGFRFAHPGYEEKEERKNKNKAGGTPADAKATSAPSGAARAQRSALRLPAFHRGSRGSEPTPPFGSRRASWDVA
jgi:hypothetical protein